MRLFKRVTVLIVGLGLALVTLSSSLPAATALAMTPGSDEENVLLNGDFDSGNTNEWRKQGNGSIGADDSLSYSPAYSLRLAPDFGQLAVLQNVSTAQIVGRKLTISGGLYSTSADRGVDILIAFMTPGGGYDITSCGLHVPASPSVWRQFSGTCTAPSTVYWSQIRITTNGSSGVVNLDDLTLTAEGAGPQFSIEKRDAVFGDIPADAAIVALSPRHDESGENDPRDEVYVMDADGSNITRITYSTWAHTHGDVSPDRTKIVVGRFWEDHDGNGKYEELRDPQSLWLLDLEHGQEWQLVPNWYWSGMGGVIFSPDGQWIYFGLIDGPFAHIYKIRPDGTGMTKISQDTAWASDIGVSRDGQWLVYHRQERNPDGSFVGKGEIWSMRTDGSENHRVSDGGPGAPGMSGQWAIGDFDAEFSPDGRQVVFAYNNPDYTGWDIVRANIDGSGRTTLINGSNTRINGIPDWGTDDRILFSVWDWTNEYYRGGATINPDGSDLRLLEGASVGDDGLAWVRWIRSPQSAVPVGGTPDVLPGEADAGSSHSLSQEQARGIVAAIVVIAALLFAPGLRQLLRRST